MRMIRKHLLIAMIVAVALMSSIQALASSVFPIVQGDTREASKTIIYVTKTRLNTLGFLSEGNVASVDNSFKFDAAMKTAVQRFQRASGFAQLGLPTDGILSERTYDMVKLSTAITYDQYKDKIHTPGGVGEEIKETKTRLKALGYLTTTVNDQYDVNAENAVRFFQRVNGIWESGNADTATRDKIFSDSAISVSKYQTESGLGPLKKGDSGNQVGVVQRQLSGLGYYTGSVNSAYDASTVDAVKLFQNANNLGNTGIADVYTRELLNSGRGKTFATYTSEQKLVSVSRGDTGYAVQLLQSRLKELYYYAGNITATCNAATVDAVKVFQKGNNLKVDGIANEETRRVMNASDALNRVKTVGLSKGDELPDVLTMTKRLCELGYLKAENSKFTAAVKTAIELFQKANGITVSGIATPETLDNLYDSSAISFEEYEKSLEKAKVERVIEVAYKYLGRPYRSNAKVPQSFDCSRYTRFVFSKVGVKMSGEVVSQGRGLRKKYGGITSKEDLERGDVLFFNTQDKKPIGHSAIYLGKIKGVPSFIHASSAGGSVMVTEWNNWYDERFLFGVRIWK